MSLIKWSTGSFNIESNMIVEVQHLQGTFMCFNLIKLKEIGGFNENLICGYAPFEETYTSLKMFKTINEKPILETNSVEDVTQGDGSVPYEAFNQDENHDSSNMASELNNFLDESLSGPYQDSGPSSFNDATLEYNNFSFNI